jgi:type VI protein secretion system component VasF
MALSFGFRGQYKDIEGNERLQWYRDQLYTLVCHQPPHLLNDAERLFDQCYQSTFREPPGRGLPDVRVWGVWMTGVLIAYLFVTYLVWYSLASDMHHDLQLIFEHARQVTTA